jgi:hypothetical protein
VDTFSDHDAAYLAVERLQRTGFTDEQVQFAMRGERPPLGIVVLGESSDRIVARSIGSLVGVVVGSALGGAAAWRLDPIDSWAVPGRALAGLLLGCLVAQLSHREAESEWSAFGWPDVVLGHDAAASSAVCDVRSTRLSSPVTARLEINALANERRPSG